MPSPDPIVQAKTVELVDDSFPTEERRTVAEYIAEHWNDDTDLTLTEIAEDTGTSRQHVKNTLETHFEIVEPAGTGQVNADSLQSMDVVELVLRAYRMGYNDGRDDAKTDEAAGSLDDLIREAQ